MMNQKINSDSPIGIFDSGLGGLTVLQELKNNLPNENYIYFGDTAHLPYGSKSNINIIEYSRKIAAFLVSKNVKAIVIACNSASSVAVNSIKKITNIPIFEVITPAATHAIQNTKTKHIGIMGTYATINSNIYKKTIQNINSEIHVSQFACPLLVPIIEEGLENSNIAQEVVELYLKPMVSDTLDTIILGCTHYPILSNTLHTVLSNKIKLISSGKPLSKSLLNYLRKREYLNKSLNPKMHFYVSDSPEKFKTLGSRFFKDSIENIEICEL